jgi:hypothetical protein
VAGDERTAADVDAAKEDGDYAGQLSETVSKMDGSHNPRICKSLC